MKVCCQTGYRTQDPDLQVRCPTDCANRPNLLVKSFSRILMNCIGASAEHILFFWVGEGGGGGGRRGGGLEMSVFLHIILQSEK